MQKWLKKKRTYIAAGLIIAGAICPYVGVPVAIVNAVGAAVSVLVGP